MGVGKRVRLLATFVIGGAVAACSLLTGLDADYKQKGEVTNTESGTDAPVADGPTDGNIPTDGSMPDGPMPADGGDSGLGFCESRKGDSAPVDFFCTDFETGDINVDAGTATGWTAVRNIVTGGSGTIQLVAGAGVGGSRGLDVSNTGTTGRQTRLYKTIDPQNAPNSYSKYELEFDFRVEASNLGYEAFGLLLFTPGVQEQEHGIAGYGPSPHLLARPAVNAYPSISKSHTNVMQWMHVLVTLTNTGASGPFTRTITLDGADVDGLPAGVPTVAASGGTEVTVGIFNSNNSGSARAQFDNIVFRRRP